MIICKDCNVKKPGDEFYWRTRNGNRTPLSYCKECHKERGAIYQLNNKEAHASRSRKYKKKLRIATIEAYGGKCDCCNESTTEFLAIDHVNGGGTKERRERFSSPAQLQKWLRDNNYPDGYRVLCHNCNSALGFYGYCPHSV